MKGWQKPLKGARLPCTASGWAAGGQEDLIAGAGGKTSRLFSEVVEAQEKKVEMKRDCPKAQKAVEHHRQGVWNRCQR
jgi:hypothetical protein